MLLEVELLADEVVGRVVGVGRVELDDRAEDVGGRLVEAAGLAGVGQVRGVLGHAVASSRGRRRRARPAGRSRRRRRRRTSSWCRPRTR